jgi:hypothetical protein
MEQQILSNQNIDSILSISKAFILQRYNRTIDDVSTKPIIISCIRQLINFYLQNPPLPSIENFNKQVISQLRDVILENNSPPTAQSSQTHQPQQLEQLQVLQEQQMRTRESEFLKPVDSKLNTPKNEEEFFKNVQLYELQRQNINLQEPTANPVIKTEPDTAQFTTPQPTNTIIYMTPTQGEFLRNIRPVILRGSDRSWLHIPERNILLFKGPLPDAMHIRFTQMMLPKVITQHTPYVNVVIKSATDKIIEILCCIEATGPVWDIWKPISKSGSLIKTFACPWTINLKDIFNKPLYMGTDGVRITNVKKLPNNNTKIFIDETNDIRINSHGELLVLDINKNDTIHHVSTAHVYENQIELIGDYTFLESNKAFICNLQSQAYIVLGMEKEDTAKEGE